MKVKKYRAESMQKAVLKVKSDLGAEAIIIHTRKFKKGGFFGFFAKKMIEVVATIEPQTNDKVNQQNDYMQGELKEMKTMMNNVLGEVKESQNNMQFMGNQFSQKFVQSLWDLGFSNNTANRLANKIIKKMGGRLDDLSQVKDHLKTEVKKEIKEIEAINIEDGQTKVIALIGPTGVGKTTTLAKLAARFSLIEGKKVGLITTDTYRIAAVEQLKTYSEIINLPLEVAFTPKEMLTAIEDYQDYDLVLVDTAGRSQNNQVHMSELKGFISKADIEETYLVLSATTKVKDILKIIDTYNEIEVDKLIVTKLDETDSLGVIFEAVSRAKKPLSYITTGQNVPEDIKLADSDELANNIVEGLEI